jgi:OHCU decarboxylase
MRLDELNTASREDFIAALADIFEHSPWVAERIAELRPFASVPELHAAMCAAMRAEGRAAQLALIRAHPQLAGKAAIAGELTESSAREQQGAGLDRCSPEEFTELTRLNDGYFARFGFPFIVAVKGHSRASIIAAMRERLPRDADAEFEEALQQIERIAGFRLAAMMDSNS